MGVHTSTASSGRLRPPGEEEDTLFASESFFGVTGSVLDLVRAQVRCEAGVFSSGMLELGTWLAWAPCWCR